MMDLIEPNTSSLTLFQKTPTLSSVLILGRGLMRKRNDLFKTSKIIAVFSCLQALVSYFVLFTLQQTEQMSIEGIIGIPLVSTAILIAFIPYNAALYVKRYTLLGNDFAMSSILLTQASIGIFWTMPILEISIKEYWYIPTACISCGAYIGFNIYRTRKQYKQKTTSVLTEEGS